MGGGILPIVIKDGNIYFLFSRESMYVNKTEDWRDFGGTPEKKETTKETAIREGWEESMGFLGDKKNIKQLIENHTVYVSKKGKYTTFVVDIKMTKKHWELPKKFREHYMKMFNKDKSKISEKGFYEKDKLMWLKLENLNKKFKMFKPWYREIVKDIYYHFKQLKN
jgi:hypothetical protein